ncbi:MAG: transcription elongation factor 1 family protein [Candidatus Helarchaeota archaeon]
MGRRKRQKVQPRRLQKRIPKIFNCPACGKESISVELIKPSTLNGVGAAMIHCSNPNCELEYSVKINFLSEPVDAYADFIDQYFEKIKEKHD